jgi:ERF superfamily
VLAYSLVHASGEREDGIYPLTGGAPQEQGSAITYARRYCLCAVTGVAADADDDGQAAQTAHQRQNGRQSAGGAWDEATEARPGGQVTRPATAVRAPETGELDAEAQVFVDRVMACTTITELGAVVVEVQAARKMNALVRNPASGRSGKLGVFIEWKRKQVADPVDGAVKTLADAGMVSEGTAGQDGAAA